MFFLNFTVGEFFIVFAALSGLITALYLLDRSKSRRVVSTLRFWTSDLSFARQKSRKRIREPWSFLLQILSILLLLLAIGQLEWGSRGRPSRKHVLLIDTSAWSTELVHGEPLLNAEKRIALQYLGRLPATDRVLLAGVDAFATPATLFTSQRTELSKALGKLQSSYSALDLARALSFARRAEAVGDGAVGEVVYIGPGRIQNMADALPAVQDLRTILVPADSENCGIRNVGLRRDEQNPNVWRVAVTIKNYATRAHGLQVTSRFPGRIVASRSLTLGPQEQRTVEYGFMQAGGGQLTTGIEPHDALPADDHVTLTMPGNARTRLAVFTSRPEIIKPLIQSDDNLEATFSAPDQYNPHPAADAILLDQFAPAEQPQIPALWIAPPRNASPVPVEDVASDAVVNAWDTTESIGANLRGKNTRVKATEVFQTPGEGDITVASVAKGPVIVAHRETGSRPKFVVLGFDPLQGELRFQATAPLLFADLLRWLCPDSKQLSTVTASLVGKASVLLPSEQKREVLSVSDQNGTRVPFEVHDRLLEFFADRQSPMLIQFRDGASIVSPVLADVAEDVWTPPGDASSGLPPARLALPTYLDLWKWLALAGGLGLLADWLLFGQRRRLEIGPATGQVPQHKDRERELVQR